MALTPSTMLPLGTPLPLALRERERDRGALEEVVGRLPVAGALAERPVLVLPSEPQIASIGCNIKWHPGAEPAWAR